MKKEIKFRRAYFKDEEKTQFSHFNRSAMKKLYTWWKSFVKNNILDNDPYDEVLPELYIHDERLNHGSWLWWVVATILTIGGMIWVGINHV